MEVRQPEFRIRPFSAAPDLRFVYAHHSFRLAFTEIWQGIQRAAGLLTLTGGPGIGKTTLLRRLKEEVEGQRGKVFFRFYPRLGFDELLTACCEEADIYHSGAGAMEKLRALARYLRARVYEGSPALLIIDDAQRITDDLLRKLELLTEICDGERSLLQVLLAGNRDFEVRLQRDDLVDVRRRIAVAAQLLPLSDDEVGPYIRYRMQVAGAEQHDFFGPKIVRRIARFSGGVPLNINRVCERAVQGAIAAGLDHVSTTILEQAAEGCRLLDEQASLARGQALGRPFAASSSTSAAQSAGPGRPSRLFPSRQIAMPTPGQTSLATSRRQDDLHAIDWAARWRAVQPTTADLYAVPPAPPDAASAEAPAATDMTKDGSGAGAQPDPGYAHEGGRADSAEMGLRRLSDSAQHGPTSASWGAAVAALPAPLSDESAEDRISRRLGTPAKPLVAESERSHVIPLVVAALGAILISGAAFLYYDEFRQETAQSIAELVGLRPWPAGPEIAPPVPPVVIRAPAPGPTPAPPTTVTAPPVDVAGAPPGTPVDPGRAAEGSATVEPAAGPPLQVAPVSPPGPVAAVQPPPQSTPPQPSSDAPVTRPILSQVAVTQLLSRGEELMRLGDPAAARLVFERAAAGGHAHAATGVGRTYDPVEFARQRLRGVPPDPDRAQFWYERAVAGGDDEAVARLAALASWRAQQRGT
ncbi:MAG TPA: AAA family ATPase, partial [Alphaproteobacteria bacterium]|nr:AAA family ATPase [Alphaproteobacteria bacterium]